jgi:hypothetical protein
MTTAILGLTAGFVFIVVLLLVLNLRTQYPWTIKAGATAAAVLFYIVTLYALPGFYGWPTREGLPDKFRLVSMEVREPRNDADEGVIYMWVVSLADARGEPRAYLLPYSKELHSRLTEAGKRMDFGQTMAGEMEQAEGTGDSGQRGGMPRFYFIERERPPAKQG